MQANVTGSPAVNVNVGELSLLGSLGGCPIVVVGAVVSIVHVNEAAVPVFPAASVDLTENVCSPAGTLA